MPRLYVDIESITEQIKADVESQGLKIVELEETQRRHNRYKSFRLCIRKSDIDKMKENIQWPDGIEIQRFFHRANNGRVGNQHNQNGDI